MRISVLTGTLLVAGCAASPSAGSIEITTPTPASVELAVWCPSFDDAGCRQRAADAAQARCSLAGAGARFVRSTLVERSIIHGEKGVFLYDCVP